MAYKFYDDDNVRFELKRVVELLNLFIKEHKRFPSKYTRDSYEFNLNRRWNKFSDSKTLNNEEKEYVNNNLSLENGLYIQKLSKGKYIRLRVKNFVKELKNFEKQNRRMPSSKNEKEKHFFEEWIEFSKPNGLNEEERKYVNANIRQELKIRECIVNFVNKFNKFVLENKRMPNQNNRNEEGCLYRALTMYKNGRKISSLEKSYLENNLVLLYISNRDYNKVNNISIHIINFVEDFNKFVMKNHRITTSSFKNKAERSLWAKYLRYVVKGEVSQIEKEYLKNNLAKIEIRQFVMDAVQNYNNFITMYKRKPKSNGKEKDECRILNDVKLVLALEDLTDKEKEYIKYELNRLYYVRQYVIDFLTKYKKFVKDNKREPLTTITEDNYERNLALTKYLYKTGRRNINEHEKKYLKHNGFVFDNDIELIK